jgi:uncharacterized protein DUF1344
MQKLTLATMVAALLLATPAFAQQTTTQPAEPGTLSMNDNGYNQSQMMTHGKIVEIDLARGTMTLDNGAEFTLAPNFEFTSSPAVGQEVDVTFDQQNGQNVAHIVEVGGTSSRSGGDQ